MSVIASGGPREVRLRQPGLPLVLDAEGTDPRPLRFGHRQIGTDRVEHPGELDGLTSLNTKRNDVLDLEVDGVADADAVAEPIIFDVDHCALHAQHLSDERSQPRHGPTQLTAEDLDELIELS